MDRRSLLTLGVAASLLVASRAGAQGQAFLSAAEFASGITDSKFADKVLLAFGAMMLNLLLFRLQKDPEANAQEKFATYTPFREQFADSKYRSGVAQDVTSVPTIAKLVDAATEALVPTLQHLEDILDAAGIRRDSFLSTQYQSAFVIMHQFFVASTKNDKWYCQIYMLELLR